MSSADPEVFLIRSADPFSPSQVGSYFFADCFFSALVNVNFSFSALVSVNSSSSSSSKLLVSGGLISAGLMFFRASWVLFQTPV
jgi:hypothetical protein